MTIDDQQLVQMCVHGNDQAWSQFVERNRKLVFGICHIFAASDQDVEDLAQEAFIKIWTNLGSYSPDRGALSKWVAAVTRNACVDRYRRNGNLRKTESIDQTLEQSETIALGHFIDSAPTPHDIVASKELTAIVMHEAQKISPEMWKVVNLRFLHELDNIEIARKLRIPEGTVKSRINRGRAQLAALMHPMQTAMATA